jgi:lipopolysaccharide/colanic/teichoic acid biosynthesis glycosyltransferase
MAVLDIDTVGATGIGASADALTLSDLPPFVTELTTADRVARRALDLTVAIVTLLVMAIPMLVIAAIVKLTSDGPILFRQERVGEGGNPFQVLKFRTMVDGADRMLRLDADALKAYQENDFKLASDDPRITGIGRFLRKASLDELPQLINVLRGDMSIVGIRPLLSEELACRSSYDQALYRHLAPGLTGRWQVAGRSDVQHDHRVLLDRGYVEQWAFATDLWILAATPLALVRTGQTA